MHPQILVTYFVNSFPMIGMGRAITKTPKVAQMAPIMCENIYVKYIYCFYQGKLSVGSDETTFVIGLKRKLGLARTESNTIAAISKHILFRG